MRTYAGLAWAGVRHRPGSWLLLTLGIALAATLPIVSAGLRAESSVAAIRSVIDALPPAKRAVLAVTGRNVRGAELAALDTQVRSGFAQTSVDDVHRSLTFRPLAAASQHFSLGAVDGLDRLGTLTSGRWPTACPPKACEVVVVTIPGGANPDPSYAGPARALGLVVTGQVELTDQRLIGTGLVTADAPLLLGGDPVGLADLAALDLFGRNSAWFGTLDPAAVAALGTDRFSRTLADLSASVNAAGAGPLSIDWPADAVITAGERATAGADQLSVLGAGGGSLLLGFGIVIAAGLRRRQQLIGRLLSRRGASGAQILVTTALQPLLAVLVGGLVGVLAGATVVVIRGHGLFADPWSVAGAAVRSELPAVAALGVAAIALTVAVTRWPESASRSTQLIADAALLAAVGGAVLITVGAASSGSGPLTAGVIVLLTLATGLIAARLWAPVAALAARLQPGRVSTVTALTGGRRRPLLSVVTAGFVAAACCSLVFAGAYQQSLRQSASDQAAEQVPLDVTISPSSQVAAPADVLDGARLRAVSDQVQVHPVVSSPVTTFAGSSLAQAVPLVGVDPSALTQVHEFAAVTGSDLAPTELAGRLTTDRPAATSPIIPAGTRRLSVPQTGAQGNTVIGLWVATADGKESRLTLARHDAALVADVVTDQPLTVRALEISLTDFYATRQAHNMGEGHADRSLASGTLHLGRLQADGRPLDWSWATWGSDQAKVSATAAELTAGYEIADVRVVIVPAYEAPAAIAAVPVAVDPQTAARAGTTGRVGLTLNGRTLPGRIVAVLPRLPGFGQAFVLADRATVVSLLSRVAPGTAFVSQVWIAAPGAALDGVRAELGGSPAATATLRYRADLTAAIAEDPVALRSILLLTVSGSIALLLAAVACAAAVRAHLDEGAAEQLALELDGVVPAGLRRLLLIRSGLALALGVVVGVAGGLALAAIAVRLVVTGPGGTAVVPPLRVVLAAGPTAAVIGAAAALGLLGCALAALTAFRSRLPQLPEVDLR